MDRILRWSGTTIVLLLMSLAVDARAQSAAPAYRLTVKIHGAPSSCRDELGSRELYVVVKRLD